jgi:hypothetical protein
MPTGAHSDTVGVEASGKVGDAVQAVGHAVEKIGKVIPI